MLGARIKLARGWTVNLDAPYELTRRVAHDIRAAIIVHISKEDKTKN